MSSPGSGDRKACDERIDTLVELSIAGPETAVDPELSKHLRSCDGCSAYLEWLAPASSVLAESVPAHDAPPALKRRVMAEVRRDTGAPARHPSFGSVLRQPRSVLAGGLAVVIAIALAGVVTVNALNGDPSRSEPVVASAGFESIEGRLMAAGDSGTLHLEGLPRLARDRVYQAWVRHDDRLVPSTVFVADRNRRGEASIPSGLDGADEVLVTTEPDGGSATPSSDPIAAVDLS